MTARVGIVMGSDSDWPVMQAAAEALAEFDVELEADVVSAHRMPDEMLAYGREAAGRGIEVIIAGAGGAAHLPGMLAAVTPLPVIGVPVPLKTLDGMDSLLSIVQMPAGRAGGHRRDRRGPQRRAARRTHPRQRRRRPPAADGGLPGRAASRRRPTRAPSSAVPPTAAGGSASERPAGAGSPRRDRRGALPGAAGDGRHPRPGGARPRRLAVRRPGAGRRAGLRALRRARGTEHRAGHGSRPALHRCRPCARVAPGSWSGRRWWPRSACCSVRSTRGSR